MTSFLDGPAKGQVLGLKRSPYFLRVVQDAKGTWDALDQLHDRPSLDEKVYVYVLVESHGMVHLRMAKGSGFYSLAQYKLYPEQPADEVMRGYNRWPAWCEATYATIQEQKAK